MAKFFSGFFWIVVILCFLTLVSCGGDTNRSSMEYFQSECLMVPGSEFVTSLKSTIDTVRQVTSVVSKFTSFLGDFRLTNAVSDCLDLLDLSSDELGWTLSASQNPNGMLFLLSVFHLALQHQCLLPFPF